MPEETVHILSTRSLQEHLVQRSKDIGIIVNTVPFIRVAPESGTDLQNKINELSGEDILVIFTSINAVKQAAALLKNTPHWKIACLNGATYNTVADLFGIETIICTADNATSLAGQLQHLFFDKAIFFCGDRRLDDLPDKLKRTGKIIEEVILYKTVNTPQRVTEHYNGIIFFSPSAVESYFSINQPTPETILFAIGTTTATAIRKYSSNKIIVSPAPEQEAMINQVIIYYTT